VEVGGNMEECRHIYGYMNDYAMGGQIVLFDDSDERFAEIWFKFCPLCGKRLSENSGEEHQ